MKFTASQIVTNPVSDIASFIEERVPSLFKRFLQALARRAFGPIALTQTINDNITQTFNVISNEERRSIYAQLR